MTRDLEGAVGRLRAFAEAATKYASGVQVTDQIGMAYADLSLVLEGVGQGSLPATPFVPTGSSSGGADGWQPIETAARDGTEIILSSFIGGYLYEEPATGRWNGQSWEPSWQGRMVIESQSDFGTTCFTFSPQPTHWMPLPAAPTTAAEPALGGDVGRQAEVNPDPARTITPISAVVQALQGGEEQ